MHNEIEATKAAVTTRSLKSHDQSSVKTRCTGDRGKDFPWHSASVGCTVLPTDWVADSSSRLRVFPAVASTSPAHPKKQAGSSPSPCHRVRYDSLDIAPQHPHFTTTPYNCTTGTYTTVQLGLRHTPNFQQAHKALLAARAGKDQMCAWGQPTAQLSRQGPTS